MWKGAKVQVAKKDSKLSTHVGMYELISRTKPRSKYRRKNEQWNKCVGEKVYILPEEGKNEQGEQMARGKSEHSARRRTRSRVNMRKCANLLARQNRGSNVGKIINWGTNVKGENVQAAYT